MSRITSLLALAAVTYAAICLITYLRQDSLLFYPQPNHPGAVAALTESAWQAEHAGVRLNGWLRPAAIPQAAPLVFYFGGNAEDVAVSALHAPDDGNFVYVNYRGYGSTKGKPSESALTMDALAVYDAAIGSVPHNGRVLAIGRSLGSGVAVHLAAERHLDGIVLITPYDSMVNAARTHYPWLPVRPLLRHRFDSARLAPDIPIPALFLIAAEDAILPPHLGHALAQAWGGPREVLELPAVGHNDIEQGQGYQGALREFIAGFSGSADI